MGSFSLSLFILLGFGALFVVYGMYRNHQRAKLNLYVSEELDVMIQNVIKQVEQNKKLSSRSRHTLKGSSGLSDELNLSSPEILSTIVTVLIHKLGTMRLSMDDFAVVPDGEYVSVYVDTITNELVFSLDKTLGSNDPHDPLSMMSFGDKDDGTFH